MHHRRLARCYERTPEHHEAMIWWATVSITTRRLTRHLADAPPHGRWSDPPPLPALTSPDRRGKVCELLAAQPSYTCEGVAPQWRDSPVAARSAVICIMLPRIVALSATRAVPSGP
jgi:hypothetical protein